MTRFLRAAFALACLALGGCGGPGHTRWSQEIGVHLFSVPIISIESARYEHMSEACAQAGDRLSAEATASPLSFLGLGKDVHLLRAGPSDSQAEAMAQRAQPTTPSSAAAAASAPGAEAGAEAGGADSAHRTDSRGRR